MTTTPRRFVIEACDDHDRTRAVVCTINVHIVGRVESVVRDGRQQGRKPPQSARRGRRSEWRTWDAAPRHVRGSIGCNRDRRMFAYQPCETPLVERTTGALEAHSLSVGGFGLRDTTCWTPRGETFSV